jgi:hypothetical protein
VGPLDDGLLVGEGPVVVDEEPPAVDEESPVVDDDPPVTDVAGAVVEVSAWLERGNMLNGTDAPDVPSGPDPAVSNPTIASATAVTSKTTIARVRERRFLPRPTLWSPSGLPDRSARRLSDRRVSGDRSRGRGSLVLISEAQKRPRNPNRSFSRKPGGCAAAGCSPVGDPSFAEEAAANAAAEN